MKDLQTAIKIGIAGIKHCIFCNRSGKPNVPDLWIYTFEQQRAL